MDWETILAGTGVELLAGQAVAIGIGLTVFVALAAFGITLRFLRKGGAK